MTFYSILQLIHFIYWFCFLSRHCKDQTTASTQVGSLYFTLLHFNISKANYCQVSISDSSSLNVNNLNFSKNYNWRGITDQLFLLKISRNFVAAPVLVSLPNFSLINWEHVHLTPAKYELSRLGVCQNDGNIKFWG